MTPAEIKERIQELREAHDPAVAVIYHHRLLDIAERAVEALEFYGGDNWNDPVQEGNCHRFHGSYSEIDISDHEKMKDGSIVGGKSARTALKSIGELMK